MGPVNWGGAFQQEEAQVKYFELESSLYWGTGGILQAAMEDTDSAERVDGKCDLDTWDNLRYAKERLGRYRVYKERLLLHGK